MAYLTHVSELPAADHLSEAERKMLDRRFDANAFELNFDGEAIEWDLIEEVEVAQAARQRSPAGWVVRNLLYGGSERYHLGVYFGKQELVLTNITAEAVRYILHTVAYYCRHDIRYNGVVGVAPLRDEIE
ncbi:MAG: hypothetical protein L6Q98_04630 [Anaerolineae bacterium]|nr:hypothetical protein [Anaerolineae bacterium]NUQ03504.1 hypothetical protein [Anaerolineae bacterium]